MRLAYFLVLLIHSALADSSDLPRPAEIPALCAQASEQIPATVKPLWAETAVNKLTQPELATLASGLDTYSPFQLYNSNSTRVSEYLTRFILTRAELSLTHSQDSLTADAILNIEPTLQFFETQLKSFLAHPELIQLPTEAEMYAVAQPDLDFQEYEPSIAPVCKYSQIVLPGCAETFHALINVAKPYLFEGGTMFAAYGSFVRFMTSPRFISGLSLYSLRATNRMRTEFSQHATPPSNVLDDLIKAYQDSGMSSLDAKDASFFVLLVYATRGAAHLQLLRPFNAPQTALIALISGISYFDRLQISRHQKSYFLPKGTEINCPYGKPYHFWMSTALAYFTHRNGYPVITSAFASYTLGVAYDSLMTANGRDYHRLLGLEPFDPLVNQERSDLFFKELGAFYGAYTGNGHPGGNYDSLLYQQYAQTGKTQAWLISLMRKQIDPKSFADKFPEFFNLTQPYSAFSCMRLKAQ